MLEDEGDALEQEIDPDATVDDSAVMMNPLASMAASDLDFRLAESLEMVNVVLDHPGET